VVRLSWKWGVVLSSSCSLEMLLFGDETATAAELDDVATIGDMAVLLDDVVPLGDDDLATTLDDVVPLGDDAPPDDDDVAAVAAAAFRRS